MPDDLEKLQGTWHVTALEFDGQIMPATAFDGAMIVIDKKSFTSIGMGFTYEGTVEVDQAKKPKTFDMLFTAGHAAGVQNLGIYKLTGDRWTICLATRGSERPDKFATEADTGLALETLERGAGRKSTRGKSRAQSRSAAVPAAAPASSVATPPDEVTPLEGEWAMVSAVFSGAPMANNMVEWTKRVTHGNVTTVLAGPQVILKASFTIDESKTPHTIDYVNVEGANRGKSQAGIFELSGDTMRICMAAPGKPRPDGFSSKSKDGRSYTTWRRRKN